MRRPSFQTNFSINCLSLVPLLWVLTRKMFLRSTKMFSRLLAKYMSVPSYAKVLEISRCAFRDLLFIRDFLHEGLK
ncbi:hypothetical protein L3X38_024491 [Prunus dulcis]|uniref:Uncharacterized protein n=1 Tax=Prunus dulcis TaxID=3755 RepID=A0AAD4Z736_PRUDU|nr:hypothetical protein L3X38_024491 [Prunus dulcis]